MVSRFVRLIFYKNLTQRLHKTASSCIQTYQNQTMRYVLIYFYFWTTLHGVLAQTSIKTIPNHLNVISTLGDSSVESQDSTEIQKQLRIDPRTANYYFACSGFHPETGRVYYHNKLLFINSFEFGIHRNFSAKIGFESNSIFLLNPIFYIMPKYSIPIHRKLRLGATLSGFFVAQRLTHITKEINSIGIMTGFLTYGTNVTHLTASIAYGTGSNKAGYNLSSNIRLHKNVSMILENWFLPTQSYYLSMSMVGIRILRKKIVIDLSVARFSNLRLDYAELIIPYASFSLKF